MNIGIFCSANNNIEQCYFDLTRELGEWIGRNKHSVVFGGCNMGLIVAFIGGGMMAVALLPLLIYATALFIDSAVQNRSVRVGLLSVPASFIQLTGYGSGFIRAWWRHYVMRREDEKTAFNKNFYA